MCKKKYFSNINFNAKLAKLYFSTIVESLQKNNLGYSSLAFEISQLSNIVMVNIKEPNLSAGRSFTGSHV